MVGLASLSWTYEELCDFTPPQSSSSSRPADAADLNPMIRRLLDFCPDRSIFGYGGHSVLISVTGEIAAKVSLKKGDPHLQYEQTILELLSRVPCPHIVQPFFLAPDITFMPLFKNGTLSHHMTLVNGRQHILPWMQQLADAVAFVESHGYAHGDINPSNIVLDDEEQLKLVDFDHALKIGDDLDVGHEPYVRFHDHSKAGAYGAAGPVTEQFALGSVFWFITRGTELWDDLDGPERQDRLMDFEFPATNPDVPVDCVIKDCWHGRFPSVADLSNRVRKIMVLDAAHQEKARICQQYYELLTSQETESKQIQETLIDSRQGR